MKNILKNAVLFSIIGHIFSYYLPPFNNLLAIIASYYFFSALLDHILFYQENICINTTNIYYSTFFKIFGNKIYNRQKKGATIVKYILIFYIFIFFYSYFSCGLSWIIYPFDASPSIASQFSWVKPLARLGVPLIFALPHTIMSLLALWMARVVDMEVKHILKSNFYDHSYRYDYIAEDCSTKNLNKNLYRKKYHNFILFSRKNLSHRIIFSLLFAFFWIVAENIRSWYIAPFPWLFIGHSSVTWTLLLQLIEILGVDGVGFYILLIASTPYVFSLRWSALMLIISLPLFIWANWRYNHFSNASLGNLPVMFVQAGISTPPESDREKLAALKKIITLTKLGQGDAHKTYNGEILVIWPESALQFTFSSEDRFIDVGWGDNSFNDFLISGVDRVEYVYRSDYELHNSQSNSEISPAQTSSSNSNNVRKNSLQDVYNDVVNFNFYNSLVVINKYGKIVADYDKLNLAPFGEYIPWLGLIAKLVPMVSSGQGFSVGKNPQHLSLPSPFNLSFTPYICYDIAFKENIGKKGQFLLHITNDVWFGNSFGRDQHLAISRIKAVEKRRYLLRVANCGFSAVINPAGEVQQIISPDYVGSKLYFIK